MSQLAVEGLRAEQAAVVELFKSLSAEELAAPSDCAGWSVRDVLAHMANSQHGVVDPAYLPDMSQDVEGAMENPVALRRDLAFDEVLEEFETYSTQAMNVFVMAQDDPMASTMLPMGKLGTHPMSILPAVFLFDTYCHLRNDVLQPHGPIDRDEPPRDEQRLRPTVEWMLAGLPWMCADELAPLLDRPIVLTLDGPGGGSWTIAPGGDDGRVAITEGADANAAATVRSNDHDFVIWGTQRRPWEGMTKIDGDDAYAAAILDVVNVI
jgi:uncharacterized protein (TIGR03083 family)